MSAASLATRILSCGPAAGRTSARSTEPDTGAFRTSLPFAPIRTTNAGTLLTFGAATPSVQPLLDG